MSSSQDSQYRTLKAKKTAAQPPSFANPGHSGPTTFFLRSEKDIEKSTHRGRKVSRDSDMTSEGSMQKTPMASQLGDGAFGVQSLEDTISSTVSSDNSLSRTNSYTSDASVEAGAEAPLLAGRKRKAGNPVHPKIMATGQRIISSEYNASQAGSPMSHRSAESPFRTNIRRNSLSSINLNQPLTPLKASPRPESAMPSTPRSGSAKSFRLSDEEASVASDNNSQAIQSSSGEEEEEEAQTDPAKAAAMPQLVMPSISMPTRRPFTERGRRMGRLKVMVVGVRGVGKTSLIQSICRTCEDVVHMDALSGVPPSQPTALGIVPRDAASCQMVEIGASTRPYPSWWTDFESRRMLLKRKSIGEGVLERNLTFIDTHGLDGKPNAPQIKHFFGESLSRIANMQSMHDSDLIHMLSGEGGVHIDAVIYIFHPEVTSKEPQVDDNEAELLQYLCRLTNVIPLIGRADTVDGEMLSARKRQLTSMFNTLEIQPCIDHDIKQVEVEQQHEPEQPIEPYAISSALGNDAETIDASVLMASSYLQPLVPSELEYFVGQLLEPDNIARLRHLSAAKYLLWRQENMGLHLNMHKQTLRPSPHFEIDSPAMESTGSVLADPSKVLVPHGSSSYFRSASPFASDSSVISANPVEHTLARYNDSASPSEPFRQVRLAKWAQDLQRSLDNERKRYKQMFTYRQPSPDWTSTSAADSEKHDLALTQHRPPKGRLGGDLGIIDPRDPLGVLAFGQAFRSRGWFVLQIAGGCGLIGAVAWWAARNWLELQEFMGFVEHPTAISVMAVPASTRGWFDEWDWKNVLGTR